MGGTLPAMAARVAGLGSYMLGASERAGVLNPVLPTSQNSEGESGGEAEAEGWKRPVLTEEEIMHDFRTFYFDTALSSYPSNVAGLEAFLKAEHLPDGPHHQHPEERILFGTDFPGAAVCCLLVFLICLLIKNIILYYIILHSGELYDHLVVYERPFQALQFERRRRRREQEEIRAHFVQERVGTFPEAERVGGV